MAGHTSNTHSGVENLAFTDNQMRPMLIQADQSLGKLFEDINKQTNRAVEDHIKRGDYVAPPGQPDRAGAAHSAIEAAMGPGYRLRDDGMTMYGGGLDVWATRAARATGEIDRKEHQIAKEHWAALSPAEQRTIRQEKEAREQYDHLAVWRSKYDPPKTPHLDAFTRGVEKAIAPLEQQREAKLHQAWREMPVEDKARIFRAAEERKHFRAL